MLTFILFNLPVPIALIIHTAISQTIVSIDIANWPLGFIFVCAAISLATKHLNLAGILGSSKDTEEQLQVIINHMLDMVCQTNHQGIIQYISPSCYATLGSLPETYIGRDWGDDVHPDDKERILTIFGAISVMNFPVRCQYRVRHTNGHYVWLESTVNPLVINGSTTTDLIWVSRDVTEQKRVEQAEYEQHILAEALRESASALNSTLNLDEVLERILIQVVRVVPQGTAARIILQQGGIIRTIRYSSTNNLNKSTMISDSVSSAEETVGSRRMVETGLPLAIPDTLAYPNWDSSPKGRPDIGAPIRSYLGAPIQINSEIIGILSVFSDKQDTFAEAFAKHLQVFADQASIAIRNARLYEVIRSHAKEMEQQVARRTAELENERAKLRAILDGIEEGVIYSENCHILYVNRALSDLTGYSPEEWNGYLDPLRSPATTENAFAVLCDKMYDYVRDYNTWRGEFRFKRKDGTEFDASMVSGQVTGPRDNVMAVVTVIRDISQEKVLDEQRKRFVSYASHELRTPITNLKTRIYLLQNQPEKSTSHLAVLSEVTNRMKRLIDDLLELSSFDHGVIPLKPKPVVVQELVGSVVRVQEPEALSKHISLTYQSPSKSMPIFADADRMTQVFTNLITNAIHYTPPGGNVTVRIVADAGDAIVQVWDTGRGISAEHIAQIFEPFFRADGSTYGSGLGLTITKEIVELHGGKLMVESKPGSGSCFTVRLALLEY